MSAPRPVGGWPTAAPSIDYWKQHQHRQLQQQQLQYQQHTQLQQQQQQLKALNHVQQQQQQQQEQQQVAWCEPPSAAAAAAADGQCNNLVTTVMVAGFQAPASPRCESVRSDAAESSCSSLSQESLSPPARPARLATVRSVAAPDGWNRVTSNGLVVYVSPSGASLTSGEEARQYLRTAGTCKCGLECPILVEKSFNFDPKVITRPRSGAAGVADSPSETTKTCNHRRKRAELLQRRAAGKDVPPTFQEQRCNPHNNPFFRDQMLQAMEQMGYRHQQQQQQQQAYQHHQQQHQQHQQQAQRLGQLPSVGPLSAVPPCWPSAGVGRLPAPPPHLLRAHWDELRRRRPAGRSRRRASPCPNVDVRQLPAAAERTTPSFLEDPSGYLARQTQMLNDTMQEGLSPVPAPVAEVPLPSTVPLPARVGKHAPPETPSVIESPAAAAAAAPDPSSAGAAPLSGCGSAKRPAAAGVTPEQPASSEPAVSAVSASEMSATSQSPAPSRPDPASQAAESSQTDPPPVSGGTGTEEDREGEAAAVSSAGGTQQRPAEATAARQTPAPTLAPAPAPAPATAAAAHYQSMVGGGEVPLVQSLPAGQIILPSGQVILTQPFQPMLQYINAFPMQQPLVVSAGGALLQSQLTESTEQAPREPAGRRRKRRQTPSVAAILQRSQQAQQAQQAAQQQQQQQQQQGGVQTLLMGGAGGGAAAAGAGKQPSVVLSGAQPGGVNFLQPVLLPGGGGQLFFQSVGGPLLTTSLAVGQAGGQLLQVVSVMGDQCQSSLPPPPPPVPAVEQQTRMAADSSTSGHDVSPDAGGGDGGDGGGSPDPQDEPVSSTGEPMDEASQPAKRPREAAEDGDSEVALCAGEMIWGSHHGLCSWPGQVVERTDVQTCEPSRVWVQWFGDHTMSLEAVDRLRKFHDHGTSKRNKSPAENNNFEEALKEALMAVERQRK